MATNLLPTLDKLRPHVEGFTEDETKQFIELLMADLQRIEHRLGVVPISLVPTLITDAMDAAEAVVRARRQPLPHLERGFA